MPDLELALFGDATPFDPVPVRPPPARPAPVRDAPPPKLPGQVPLDLDLATATPANPTSRRRRTRTPLPRVATPIPCVDCHRLMYTVASVHRGRGPRCEQKRRAAAADIAAAAIVDANPDADYEWDAHRTARPVETLAVAGGLL